MNKCSNYKPGDKVTYKDKPQTVFAVATTLNGDWISIKDDTGYITSFRDEDPLLQKVTHVDSCSHSD